jgi:hypothetical protein
MNQRIQQDELIKSFPGAFEGLKDATGDDPEDFVFFLSFPDRRVFADYRNERLGGSLITWNAALQIWEK